MGQLNHLHWREISSIDEEIAQLRTRQLLDHASKYNILYQSTPSEFQSRQDGSFELVPGSNENWEASPVGQSPRLTTKATNELRAAIRKERNERWASWELRGKILLIAVSAVAGTVAALAGLRALVGK